MGIDVRIETDEGDLWEGVTNTLPGSPDLLGWLIWCSDDSKTCCLRFIDPFGDTTFNSLQTEVLAEELRAASNSITDESILAKVQESRITIEQPPTAAAVKAYAAKLIAMVMTASSQHAYVKFVGD
jgi:hypothetical protein